MGYSRTLEARQSGAVQLVLDGYNSEIEVTCDPFAQRATVEVYTAASSGSTIESIDGLSLRESGGQVELLLPEGAGGGQTVVSSGDVIVTGSGVVMSGGGSMVSSFSGGRRGRSRVVVNGTEIIAEGGRTWVNGQEVTDKAGKSGPAADPPSPVHLRAVVPAGSSVRLRSYNGCLTSTGVTRVDMKSYNGDIRATGLTEDSTTKSYNGDIAVGALPGFRPQVRAETYNGDIRVLDDDIRVRPKTHNGDIRYPS